MFLDYERLPSTVEPAVRPLAMRTDNIAPLPEPPSSQVPVTRNMTGQDGKFLPIAFTTPLASQQIAGNNGHAVGGSVADFTILSDVQTYYPYVDGNEPFIFDDEDAALAGGLS